MSRRGRGAATPPLPKPETTTTRLATPAELAAVTAPASLAALGAPTSAVEGVSSTALAAAMPPAGGQALGPVISVDEQAGVFPGGDPGMPPPSADTEAQFLKPDPDEVTVEMPDIEPGMFLLGFHDGQEQHAIAFDGLDELITWAKQERAEQIHAAFEEAAAAAEI